MVSRVHDRPAGGFRKGGSGKGICNLRGDGSGEGEGGGGEAASLATCAPAGESAEQTVECQQEVSQGGGKQGGEAVAAGADEGAGAGEDEMELVEDIL